MSKLREYIQQENEPMTNRQFEAWSEIADRLDVLEQNARGTDRTPAPAQPAPATGEVGDNSELAKLLRDRWLMFQGARPSNTLVPAIFYEMAEEALAWFEKRSRPTPARRTAPEPTEPVAAGAISKP